MESLLSLAGYSYEHPSDPFPEFTDESPFFEGEALAHPLIPETRGVRNDLRLDGHLRVLVVRPTSPTSISRTTSRTDASGSTTACGRESWNTATLWS